VVEKNPSKSLNVVSISSTEGSCTDIVELSDEWNLFEPAAKIAQAGLWWEYWQALSKQVVLINGSN